MRVTLRSGSRLTLENPTMRNDSIFGVTNAGVVGVASQDLGLLEVQRLSILRTVGATWGLAVLALSAVSVLLITACALGGRDDCFGT